MEVESARQWNRLVPELVVAHYLRSKRFCVDALGFQLVFERPESRFGYFDLHGAQIMLLQADEAAAAPHAGANGTGIHFQIEVDCVDAVLARLADLRVPLDKEPYVAWYRQDSVEHGQREFFVKDPDGYLFRFAEYLGERPARTMGT
jgi:catechol 2,3-dioxygenase-like lactoylglutathione lyase family enzyme